MVDFMLPETRSKVMSRIRSRDTRPELYVRRSVWREGFRYRVHVKSLPGVPDLVLAKYRIAVFVHGCFWHQHGCPVSHIPDSNRGYWGPKLAKNKSRDKKNKKQLRLLGWDVRTIRECRLERDTLNLINFLNKQRDRKE